MKVEKVAGNCSMLTVSQHYKDGYIKEEFLIELDTAIKEHNFECLDLNRRALHPHGLIDRGVIKTVVLTTNSKKWFPFPFMKKAFSYKGNSNDKAKVYHMDFPKGLHKALIKEGIY